jgi:hypothetical protein
MGGRLVSWYLSFGEYDGLTIYEAPDDATAGALVVAAARPGHFRATKTTPLFTAEESVEMMRRAGVRPTRHRGSKQDKSALETPRCAPPDLFLYSISENALWTNFRLCEAALLVHRPRSATHGSGAWATGRFGTHASARTPPQSINAPVRNISVLAPSSRTPRKKVL